MVVATALPTPDDESLSSVLKLSFDRQLDMGAVLTMVTGHHVIASVSPVRLHVGVDAAARLVHFLRTFERYLSNHILGDASRIPHDAAPERWPAAAGSPLVQELVVEMDRITLLLETGDDGGTPDCFDVFGSSLDETPDTGTSRASFKAPSLPLRHAVALSLGARLKYADTGTGQACSLDLGGLFVTAFPSRVICMICVLRFANPRPLWGTGTVRSRAVGPRRPSTATSSARKYQHG